MVLFEKNAWNILEFHYSPILFLVNTLSLPLYGSLYLSTAEPFLAIVLFVVDEVDFMAEEAGVEQRKGHIAV